ncbi:MAG TPA: hypothetical protein VI547_00180, partial [Anaerolineales bacterium]|nr:hypothetical protein [Anaerolineales bacterium]
MAVEYIDRPPRVQPELPIQEIQIPNPPEEQSGQQSLMGVLLPAVMMVGFIISSGSGNMSMVIIMGLMMFGTVGMSLSEFGKGRKEFEAKKKAYEELLVTLRQDMARHHNTQRTHYHHNYPASQTILEVAARKETSRFGSRLWERRPGDKDFGMIRLGIGTRPSTVIYKFGSGDDPLSNNQLTKDARKLHEDSLVVTDVPVTIPLRPTGGEEQPGGGAGGGDGAPSDEGNPKTKRQTPRHSIGIVGKNPTATADFARSILADFTCFHTSYDARLYVVGLPQNKGNWQWCEWIPHCTVRGIGEDDDADKPKEFDQLCFSPDKNKIQAFWKRLKKDLDQRQVRLRDTGDDDKKKGGVDVTLPMTLVVVDLLGDMPKDSYHTEVASEAVVGTINSSGPTLGAAIIFLASDPSKIPSECQAMIELATVGEKTVFRYTEVGLNSP